jgi:hypothetical protein
MPTTPWPPVPTNLTFEGATNYLRHLPDNAYMNADLEKLEALSAALSNTETARVNPNANRNFHNFAQYLPKLLQGGNRRANAPLLQGLQKFAHNAPNNYSPNMVSELVYGLQDLSQSNESVDPLLKTLHQHHKNTGKPFDLAQSSRILQGLRNQEATPAVATFMRGAAVGLKNGYDRNMSYEEIRFQQNVEALRNKSASSAAGNVLESLSPYANNIHFTTGNPALTTAHALAALRSFVIPPLGAADFAAGQNGNRDKALRLLEALNKRADRPIPDMSKIDAGNIDDWIWDLASPKKKKGGKTINVHNMSHDLAEYIMRTHLNQLPQNGNTETTIITGQGTHGANGQKMAKILGEVASEYGFNVRQQPGNPGAYKVSRNLV